jgi:hypothetical protein
MTYRSFRRDSHLDNGFHIVNANMKTKEFYGHTTTRLRYKYKINITIHRENWTHEVFTTYYYPEKGVVVVDRYNFKLLEPKVTNTSSLIWCGREQVYDYYKKYVDNTISEGNISWLHV